MGHISIGLEGSDFSLLEQRAEWRTIPDYLFTADITRPFSASRNGTPLQFDVITAWEVLEHIPEDKIDGLFANIVTHLAPGGMFVCSVALFEDKDPVTGAVWHVTLRPREWWENRLAAHGLVSVPTPFQHRDYVRGGHNPRAIWDWDAETSPEMGFHLTVKHAGE
ncbi:MAG: class I SAM-dependent methyltransferase [Parvibaculaceae bacterium]|nr:class I SAM-dependent methyltransferase [Parvibaculaceae bacterium]